MAVKPIPDGYHAVTPYLLVHGATGLIEFLQRAFGAREVSRTTTPDGGLMHADLVIGDSHVMLSEATERWPAMPASIYLYLADTDAAYRRAVKAGATSLMEPEDQFYGDRSAGVRDPSGNCWWIATHIEDVSSDEMARRTEEFFGQRQR